MFQSSTQLSAVVRSMVDPGCVAFSYVCIAYDVCKLGKSPWQCQDLPRENIDEIVKQWAEAGRIKLQKTRKGVKIDVKKLCEQYERCLRCYSENPCGIDCMHSCMQLYLQP